MDAQKNWRADYAYANRRVPSRRATLLNQKQKTGRGKDPGTVEHRHSVETHFSVSV